MDISQIKKYWQDNGEALYVCPLAHISKASVNKETFEFLTTCGLPSDAAPFLSFGEIRYEAIMTPNDYFQIKVKRLDKYLVIGINGSGDPICIDRKKDDEIVYLNHDNDFERIFMNKNILSFATCLIYYREFMRSIIVEKNGSFTRRKFSDSEYEQLLQAYRSLDSLVLSDNSFWLIELYGLLWERDNE
jgi:hypothetical protein